MNNVNLGQTLSLDRRTVDRYLAVLERRFLLTRLPNLALTPTTQSASRAKAHAFDTAVAAESLRRSGVDLKADRERFGQLLESWVVQQLMSAATWSSFPVEGFYWRRSKRPTAEVDLVLVDDRGRTVSVHCGVSPGRTCRRRMSRLRAGGGASSAASGSIGSSTGSPSRSVVVYRVSSTATNTSSAPSCEASSAATSARWRRRH